MLLRDYTPLRSKVHLVARERQHNIAAANAVTATRATKLKGWAARAHLPHCSRSSRAHSPTACSDDGDDASRTWEECYSLAGRQVLQFGGECREVLLQ